MLKKKEIYLQENKNMKKKIIKKITHQFIENNKNKILNNNQIYIILKIINLLKDNIKQLSKMNFKQVLLKMSKHYITIMLIL